MIGKLVSSEISLSITKLVAYSNTVETTTTKPPNQSTVSQNVDKKMILHLFSVVQDAIRSLFSSCLFYVPKGLVKDACLDGRY